METRGVVAEAVREALLRNQQELSEVTASSARDAPPPTLRAVFPEVLRTPIPQELDAPRPIAHKQKAVVVFACAVVALILLGLAGSYLFRQTPAMSSSPIPTTAVVTTPTPSPNIPTYDKFLEEYCKTHDCSRPKASPTRPKEKPSPEDFSIGEVKPEDDISLLAGLGGTLLSAKDLSSSERHELGPD